MTMSFPLSCAYLSASWVDERHQHRTEHIALDTVKRFVRFNSVHNESRQVSDSKWHGRWMFVGPFELLVQFHYRGDQARYLHAVQLKQDQYNANLYRGINYPVLMKIEGYMMQSGEMIPPMPLRRIEAAL